MKNKEKAKCICCGGFTLNRFKGFWVHKKCLSKTIQLLKQVEYEIPLICQQIVLSSRKCLEASILSVGVDDKKFQAIQHDVHKKAWQIFKERHPTEWIKK